MKVTLISAPREDPQVADFPPLGLAYVGAAASKAGHSVRILDAAAWTWDRLETAVAREAPDLVGFTCWTIERGQVFEAARVAKRAAPRALVVMGGPHATAFPSHMFLKAPTDYVVLGEGEQTTVELLAALEHGTDPSTVPGLAYRRNGECLATGPRPFVSDLDSVQSPFHEQFDYDHYQGLHDRREKSAAIMTSRGCPFSCTFCSSSSYWGHRYRKRSVANVLGEIAVLRERCDVHSFLFFDDNLLIDRQRCISLCKAICEQQPGIRWAAEGSVKVDKEMLSWMKRAGCYRIDFGVESGSPVILKNVRKPFSVDDTRTAFRLCKEEGIQPNAYLIFGAPGETHETIAETVALMREIQPTAANRGGRPGVWLLPGTAIYEDCKSRGLISDDFWLHSDDTPYYTAEYTKEQLRAFPRQFNLGMARGRGRLSLLLEILRDRLPRPARHVLGRMKKTARHALRCIRG